MTFGQLSVFRSLEYAGSPEQADANLTQVWDLPEGTSVSQAQAAWWHLVQSNESLRTTYAWDPSPVQVVRSLRAGALPTAELAEPAVAQASLVAAKLAAEAMRPGTDVPWRAVIATHAGRAAFLVVVVHHMAIDGYGFAELQGQFRDVLAGKDLQAELTPTELALEQQADRAGQDSALDYWCRVWPGFTAEDRKGHDGGERIQAAIFSERALAAATALSTRLRIPGQSVCLGVSYLVLAAVHGRRRVTLGLMSSNRFTPRLKSIITSMNQLAPVAADADPGLAPEDFLRGVFARSMEAYRSGIYDVDAVRRRLAGAGALDPEPFRFSSYFNFVGDDGTPEDAPLARDRVLWQPTKRRMGATFNLFVATRGGVYAVARSSRSYMDESMLAGVLTGIEAALVDIEESRPAALADIDLTPLRPVDGGRSRPQQSPDRAAS
jgi:Condensation domain